MLFFHEYDEQVLFLFCAHSRSDCFNKAVHQVRFVCSSCCERVLLRRLVMLHTRQKKPLQNITHYSKNGTTKEVVRNKQQIVGNVFLVRRHIPQKGSMLRAISGKRSWKIACVLGIGDHASHVRQRFAVRLRTARCWHPAHVARVV